MRVMTVVPGDLATAGVEERPEPPVTEGAVLVEGLLLGLCGTDVEIARDGFGVPPQGARSMVLGHESLGRVVEAAGGFAVGDLVAGVVRRSCGCAACEDDQWDMCLTGDFEELGIRRADGYGATAWRADPRFLIPLPPVLGDLGVLLEPTSVVAKAWEQVQRIGARAYWDPQTVLVTGAGPIGLLAAMMGVQQGLDVHVLDLATTGVKPSLVADLGATYHSRMPDVRPQIVLECTGAEELIGQAVAAAAPNAVLCLAGISVGRAELQQAQTLIPQNHVVLHNQVLFGTVNAGRRHHDQAAAALAAADQEWLARLITKRVPMSDWVSALSRDEDDVKTVIDLQG
jgi:threonine dehydrogenase-like Zn-dependent dehydrogenase